MAASQKIRDIIREIMTPLEHKHQIQVLIKQCNAKEADFAALKMLNQELKP